MSEKRERLSDLTIDEQLEHLRRGTEHIISEEELREKLELSAESKKPLRIKSGYDPSAPDIHIGHTIPLKKMRQFQDLGHEVIFLIGDFTGMIGDPSGRSKTRPQLTREEVETNAETYRRQVFKILDPDKTVIEFNSRWLGKLSSEEFIKLASHYTVARMLERDEFALRFKDGVAISIHEFLYPLLQAYDSVALEADVELGASDQLFNLLVGREIMRGYEQPPQVVLTVPLLVGLCGKEKMSKSLGNYIGIDEPPNEIYGKVMSVNDELMFEYFRLLTEIPEKEIDLWKEKAKKNEINPRDLKARLAREIVREYHGAAAAKKAEEEFERIFRRGLSPEEAREKTMKREERKIWLPKLLSDLNLASSNSEAKRLIRQKAVSFNGEKIADENYEFDLSDPRQTLIRVGKKRFLKLKIE